jgi:uncharacterized protein YndB with AHSA1/START domain
MKRTFILLLGAVGLLVAAILIYAATRPDSFRIERSASIKAPPEKIFPLISDFHQWTAWSPWENIDPQLKRAYSGAPSGRGAAYSWEGNSKVGSGRMEITDAAAPLRVVIRLDFIEPIEGHNTTEFKLEPAAGSAAGATAVTWAMFGPSPYLSKVMGVFFNMDSMVGNQFELGLANLRSVSER